MSHCSNFQRHDLCSSKKTLYVIYVYCRLLYQRPDKSTVPIDVPGGEDTTQYTLTGLSPGTQYNIVIRAVNDAGAGKWSQPFLTVSTESPSTD